MKQESVIAQANPILRYTLLVKPNEKKGTLTNHLNFAGTIPGIARIVFQNFATKHKTFTSQDKILIFIHFEVWRSWERKLFIEQRFWTFPEQRLQEYFETVI